MPLTKLKRVAKAPTTVVGGVVGGVGVTQYPNPSSFPNEIQKTEARESPILEVPEAEEKMEEAPSRLQSEAQAHSPMKSRS